MLRDKQLQHSNYRRKDLAIISEHSKKLSTPLTKFTFNLAKTIFDFSINNVLLSVNIVILFFSSLDEILVCTKNTAALGPHIEQPTNLFYNVPHYKHYQFIHSFKKYFSISLICKLF